MTEAPAPAAPHPRKKRRWLRRIGLLLILLVALVVAAPLALSVGPVRRFVAEKLSERLGRRLTIGGITAAWWSGIELRDVEVHNPAGWQGSPLLSVDRVKVEVALGKALGGAIDATVWVDRPVVTLLRTADGRSNADGLLDGDDAQHEKPSQDAPPQLTFHLKEGRIASHALPEAGRPAPEPDVVDAITVEMTTRADGALSLEASAVARGAKAGGGDVPIHAATKLDKDGAGSGRLTVPTLNLERLSNLLGATTGIERLSGTLDVDGTLTFGAASSAAGTLRAALSNLSVTQPQGTVSLASAVLDGKVTRDATVGSADPVLDLVLDGTIDGLRVAGDATTAPYEEPKVTLGLTGRWDGGARSLTLTRATIAARALRAGAGSAKAPFVVRLGKGENDGVAAEGQIAAVLDLGLLGGLATRFPWVSSLGGGTVRADATAAAGTGLSVTWKVEGTDLAFTPGELSTKGFTERRVLASGSYEQPAQGDGVVSLATLTSSFVSLVPGGAPVRIRLGDSGATLEGKARFTVDLFPIGRAIDKGVGLRAGEVLAGTLDLGVTASTEGALSHLDVTLSSRDLRLPGTAGPAPLEAGARVTQDAQAKTTEVVRGILKGYGLDVKVAASLGPVGDATGLRTASISALGDLAEARPLLGMGLALAPDAVLSGRLDSRVDVKASGQGRVLTGKTTIERLRYVPGRAPATPGKPGAPAAPPRAPTPIEEASVVIEHALSLGVVADTTRFDRVTLRSGIANASITGSMRTRDTGTKEAHEEETDVDLKIEVDADAARLADTFRSLLGEGYEDMAGEGRVKGQFVLVGPTGNDGRDLRIDGDLAWRRFASGGISSEDGKVTLRRPAPGTPLLATAKSKVNGGTFDVQATCDLGKEKSPWTAKAKVVGLDTSPMVTGKGASRYLPLLLPAIVPAGSTSPVLSGRLDADLDLRSDALREPGLSDTLSGPGSIKMTQGSVSDSTLFSALSGQSGGGSLGMLAKAVPSLGGGLAQLGKSVMFSELSSSFRLGKRMIALDPVVLVSPSVTLRFGGVVGFDGTMDLAIPLVLGGDVGAQVGKVLPNRTIPLRVRGKTGALSVTPDLKMESIGKGLLEGAGKGLLPGGDGKGKGLLDGLEGLLPGGKKKDK